MQDQGIMARERERERDERESESMTKDIMAISFMTMLMAGPEVSLNGSPTVSPVSKMAVIASLQSSQNGPMTAAL